MFRPIAQLHEPPCPWPLFLDKAAKGAHKAAEWLVDADRALAESWGGRAMIEEADLADGEQPLHRALSSAPPFRTVQDLLDQAQKANLLAAAVVAADQPFETAAHYDRLWRRGAKVPPDQLLHDAAHKCYRHWDVVSFRKIIHRVETAQLGYNSLDAVAGMLYVSSARIRTRR